MNKWNRKSIGWLTLCMALGAGGCAIQYVDEHGARHVVGLSHVITREQQSESGSAYMQQVTTVGVALIRVPEQQGISIGYTRNFSLNVLDANTAGELSIDLSSPGNFSYRNLPAIIEEGIQ